MTSRRQRNHSHLSTSGVVSTLGVVAVLGALLWLFNWANAEPSAEPLYADPWGVPAFSDAQLDERGHVVASGRKVSPLPKPKFDHLPKRGPYAYGRVRF